MGDGLKRAFAAAKAARTETPEVEPGSVWADNDPRSAGRTLRVDVIEDGKAVCTVLTNDTTTQARIDGTYQGIWARAYPQDRRGKTTRISLSRFQLPGAGYRLIDVDKSQPDR